ncbi:MAG: SRPBCC family protein [Myxococcota bacterium]
MQEVQVEHRYAGPPQAVWDVYTDHANWKDWAGMPSSRVVKTGAPDPNGTGCVRALGAGARGVLEEVVDFEPPKRMTYRVVGGIMPLRDHLGEVLFEPDGDGTRIVWRCRFESTIPGLGWALRLGIRAFFAAVLRGLERVHFPA